MEYLFGAVIFLFGAAIGSFISVVANRYNTGLPCVKGRSFCFSCNTELKSKDLFPIFSFLFLKGKCRYCQSKIPKETFVTEIIMGVLSVLAAFKSGLLASDFSILHNLYLPDFAIQAGFIIQYFIILSIFAAILLLSVYDLKHFIIPDSFLIVFLILSLFYSFFFTFHFSLFTSLLSGLILTLPFLLIFLTSRGRWLGFGDVKYIAVIGFFLGLAQGISAVILAFWIGAALSLLVLLLKRVLPRIHLPIPGKNLTIKSEIPFGPFLSVGVILSFYFALDLFQINFLFDL